MIDLSTAGRGIQDLLGSAMSNGTSYYEAPASPTITERIRQAIAKRETGGITGDPYPTSQYSGRKDLGNALGKYRVTEGEMKSYAQHYTGMPRMSSKDFLASPLLQDEYMDKKINWQLSKGYTPQQIADMHISGMTHSRPPGSTAYQDPAYVKAFNNDFLAPRTVVSLTQ